MRKELLEKLTPIWDREMGDRMRLMRMALFLDQSQLGQLLGVSASTISDIENAKIAVPRAPFSYAKFMEVFGKRALHILLGTNHDAYHYLRIQEKYWNKKHGERGKGKFLRTR